MGGGGAGISDFFYYESKFRRKKIYTKNPNLKLRKKYFSVGWDG